MIIWQYDDHHLQFTNPKTRQKSDRVMIAIMRQNNNHHLKFADCHSDSSSFAKAILFDPVTQCEQQHDGNGLLEDSFGKIPCPLSNDTFPLLSVCREDHFSNTIVAKDVLHYFYLVSCLSFCLSINIRITHLF